MVNEEIISEFPISSVELKRRLESIEKRDKEISNSAKKTKEYLNLFVKLTPKQAEELSKKITALNISRLKERHIAKIIDIMPKDTDSLKALLAGENITVKQEDIKRIVETL